VRGGRLLDDYRAGRPEAARFFAGRPEAVASYRAKLAEVARRFGPAERARAAAALRPTSAAAAARLERFVREGGAMVTTGQQAGLFTGPMYTVHKILTAIRLSQALEDALGTVVLPVFWCATEDHDFAEAGHTYAVDGAGTLRRLGVAPTDPRPLAMSEMRLGEDVERVSGEMREIVAAHGGTGVDLRDVLAAYRSGETVGSAFRATVERLFGGFDLLVADAADPALKAASLPVLLGDVERAAEHERRLAERTREIEEAGYGAPVTVLPDAANVFFHGPAGRERLQRAGGGWAAAAAGLRFTPAELAERMRGEPGAFSPNVFLRPVVESAVFPTLAYVGGPAEVAYFAQVGPLFEAYGILPPVAFPRFSARLVPDDVARGLAELGISDAELALPEHELAVLLAKRRLPDAVRDRLAELRTAMVSGFGGLIDAAGSIDPNLAGAIGTRRNRALLEAAEAERKVLSHLRKRDPAIARTLPRIRAHLAPLGAPQERALNVLPYLAMRPTLLHDLAERMEVRFAAEDGALHAPAAAAAAPSGRG
jgi:bacillithiol biosynthesis cysteine-adding enzyme BshC